MHHRPPARSRRLAHVANRDPQALGGALGRVAAPARIPATPGRRVRCTGWTWPFADERLRSVEVLIDGKPASDTLLTLRPDIAEALDLPEAALSGFETEVELPPDPGGEATVRLTALARGLGGGSWDVPGQVVPLAIEELPVDPAPPVAWQAIPAAATAPDAAPRSARAEAMGRELRRRRLGYDPWHTVVLIEGPAALPASGAAVAALDVLAERHPTLELLIAGVAPESVLADLLRRTIVAAGLADRVTVAGDDAPPDGWAAIADLPIDAARARDLAAMIDHLAAAAQRDR